MHLVIMNDKRRNKYKPPRIKVIRCSNFMMNLTTTSASKADSSKEMESRKFETSGNEYLDNSMWDDDAQ